MEDFITKHFSEQIRLGLEGLAREELGKLTKEELIEFIIESLDLMRNPPLS